MSAKKFYEMCNSEAKYFFNIYFAFMTSIYNIQKSNSEFAKVVRKQDNSELSFNEKNLFYFLFAVSLVPTSVSNMIRMHYKDIGQFYDYGVSVVDLLLEVMHKSKDFTDEEKENFFAVNLKYNLDVIASLYEGDVTIQELLIRLLNSNLAHYENLVNDFNLIKVREKILKDTKIDLNRDKITVVMQPTQGKIEKSGTSDISLEELTKNEILTDPLIGREAEMRLFASRLLDRKKSVILYGKPGVGKTTIVESLAYRIQKGLAHPKLNQKRIFSVSATEMVQGTIYRGLLEKRMLDLINYLMDIPDAILFIDEIHMLMGAGLSQDNSMDVSNILKPYLGNGKIKIAGATTLDEYKLIGNNGAFARRFKGVFVPELDSDTVLKILLNEIEFFKKETGIDFTYDNEMREKILRLIISLAQDKYVGEPRLYNPDLALTLLDNGYNFAEYDMKDVLSLDTLIEGVLTSEEVNDAGKSYFKDEALKLAREK